jgi:translation initiation factor 5B
MIRQPIITVLGHVDHGKTLLLDRIRGTSVAEREPGRITQHIGATEVPIETIRKISGTLIERFKFELSIPGLLFIDTPGHEAFSNLRRRGGNVSDLAVLVVDITQGIQPQTVEAINILKEFKTPFIVAANKIDKLKEWDSRAGSFLDNLTNQSEEAKTRIDEKLYELVGELYRLGFASERFDRCKDFTKQIPIVPCSAMTGEGIPEILVLLAGLSQKYLGENLKVTPGEKARGTVLEVREEEGIGSTVDVILYKGVLRVGQRIGLIGRHGVIDTKIRCLLKPMPLQEIRDTKKKFVHVKEAVAACGIKIGAPKLEDAIAGSSLLEITSEADIEELKTEVSEIKVEGECGVIVKADTLGTLEALCGLLKKEQIPIFRADVGSVTKKDVVEAASMKETNPLLAVIFAFNVRIEPSAEEMEGLCDVKVFMGNVIYKLIEDYQLWYKQELERIKEEQLQRLVLPAKLKVLPNYIFRRSHPAIVGVRIMTGKIRPNIKLVSSKGKLAGTLQSIQSKGKTIDKAEAGEEVAISIDKAVVGRSFKEDDTLYSYIPTKQLKRVEQLEELSNEERELLKKISELSKKVEKEIEARKMMCK